jgi:2-dehydropantoate 2-reductase
VIFDRRNGDLFGMSEICRLMNLLLAEASHVIRLFPEIRSTPSAQDRFATSRLMNVVVDVAEKTAQNTSSMLQDVRAGRATEIDYINGYIIRRGRELGIDCNNNERLVQLVKNVDIIDVGEIRQYFPDYAK